LPDEVETYVHRIGRTARAGAEGVAYSLVCAHDRNALREIEAFIGSSIEVDLAQPLHSETARTAMGAAASRPPKQAQPRPQGRERPPKPQARATGAPSSKPKAKAPVKPKTPFYQSKVRAKRTTKDMKI
jgi:ATP-dependent RNA helicase RhlE